MKLKKILNVKSKLISSWFLQYKFLFNELITAFVLGNSKLANLIDLTLRNVLLRNILKLLGFGYNNVSRSLESTLINVLIWEHNENK